MFNYDQIRDLANREQKKQFKSNIPFYTTNSQGQCRRDMLIQWVVSQSTQFKHSIKTLELAVLYIDTYLNFFNIGPQYLELLAISAYSVASKFNETEMMTQIKLYNSLGQPLYDDSEYNEMEILILQSLNYQLNQITASDYLLTMNVSINENIHSLLLFILMDFELYQNAHIVLALAVIHFTTNSNDIFQQKVVKVSSQIGLKILKAQDQSDKLESEDTKPFDQSSGITKKISKQPHSRKKENVKAM